MDPLTALSLASNIVQFIDFTSKVVSKCREIHTSADGPLPEHQELELITSDLARLSKLLEQETWPKREKPEEKSLHDLSNASVKIANELLHQVTKHKVADGAPRGKWKSFREALETVWSKKELDELARRLAQLRGEMTLHVLVEFKKKFDLADIQQARRFDWLDSHTKFLIRSLSDTRAVIESKIDAQSSGNTDLHQGTRVHVEEQHTKTREVIVQALKHYQASEGTRRLRPRPRKKLNLDMMKEEDLLAENSGSDDSDEAANHESWFQRKARYQRISQERDRIKCEVVFREAILQSLTFPTMQNRHYAIAEAHARTFEWIYGTELSESTPWSSFGNWLTSGSGIYWVNGKAGSGKSTLMRFIYEDPRTSKMLKLWGGSAGKVTTAGFFFWNSGSPDQASQLGLLRSVLHGILSSNEKLIPAVFPSLYEDFRNDLPPKSEEFLHMIRSKEKHRWNFLELKHAFQRLLKEEVGKVCLFIDGLDEYAGDPLEVVTLFKLVISTKTKICISSRPWVVFEDEFRTYPQLKLQDLTSGDIRTYVNDTLCDNERMKRLYDSEPLEAPKLVEEIVTKAAGVFLWVRLVVSSLLRGLMNRDQMSDLQQRIKLVPSELEALFAYMMKQVEEVYAEECARILRIMLAFASISAIVEDKYAQGEGLAAIDLSFALESDESVAIQSPLKILKDSEVAERVADIDFRLKVRCAGLLEIPSYWQRDSCSHNGRIFSQKIGGARVQWLHRSVRDFLETDGQKLLLSKNSEGGTRQGKQFSPSELLLRASLLQLKRWFLNVPVSNGIHPLPGLIERTMITAHQAEKELCYAQTALLDAFDKTVDQLWQPNSEHWMREIFPTSTAKDFISLCHHHKLQYYISDKICENSGGIAIADGVDGYYLDYIEWSQPTLAWAADGESKSRLVRNEHLLQALLRLGCNPNRPPHNSPWHKALVALIQQTPVLENGQIWISIVRTFLGSGADAESIVRAEGHRYLPRAIISNAFARDFPEGCRELLGLLPQEPGPEVTKASNGKARSWLKRRFSPSKGSIR